MSEQNINQEAIQQQDLTGSELRLDMILVQETHRPWFLTLFRNLKEYFFPPKLPPLEVTSKPLSPEEMQHGIWGRPDVGEMPEAALARFRPGEAFDSPHLRSLAEIGNPAPWHRAVFRDLKEYFFPPKLPPLEVTAKPVAVKSIWGFSGGHEKRAGAISTLVHGGTLLLLFVAGTHPAVQQTVKETVSLIAPDIAPYVPEAPPKPKDMGGGGGGGDRSPTPASKGQLPRVAPRQFVPPAAVVHNPDPKLIMEPTIVVPPDIPLPNVNLPQWGDPLAKIGPPSSGPGSGGGIGSGSGGGVGSGEGPGFGPGRGGGVGGGVYRIGGGVTAPTVLFKVEPEYSEEARKAKFQGTVVLSIVVDEKGLPRELKIVRALGLGLDEKAIEAVQKWRFRPGYLNGKPVAVAATIEVNFRLL